MKLTQDLPFYSAPIAAALKNIEFRLASESVTSPIVAAPTEEEFRTQDLPQHLRITAKKRQGKRIVVRERRHYYQAHRVTARWPSDGLIENSLPSLAYVMHGQADLIVADYILHLRAGDLLLYPAGIPKQDGNKPHFEGDPTGKVCDVFWIRPQDNGLRIWICRSEGNKHRSVPELGSCWLHHRFLSQMFIGFVEEAQKGCKKSTFKLLLVGFLAMLRDEVENGNALKEWGRPRYFINEQDGNPIVKALAYIEENLDQHLTIEDVAREVLVSPATFTRRLKEHTGETFSQYQTRLRMKVAEEMLLNSNSSITAVCRRVGLQHGRLLELFHQKHGCSPGVFRQNKR